MSYLSVVWKVARKHHLTLELQGSGVRLPHDKASRRRKEYQALPGKPVACNHGLLLGLVA